MRAAHRGNDISGWERVTGGVPPDRAEARARSLNPLRVAASIPARLRAAVTDPLPNIFDLILAATAAGALLLVAADIYQRWIGVATWTLNIDGRFNAVTWFHSFVLAGAAMSALGLAAVAADPKKARAWLFVGLAFAFLSFDKSISFHERLGQELEEWFGLADEAGRVLWQAVYAPFLLILVVTLFRIVPARDRWRTAIVVAVALCASKLALEALMLPAIELGITSEAGILYGLEVNLEETLQLLGFGVFFATFTALFLSAIPRPEPPAP